MFRARLSPQRYRAVSIVALLLICLIVVTGAAVRLTGSGLGCDDWPNCNDQQLIDVSSPHAAIEQVNRLFTGFVAVGVAAAVLGSLARVPRRRDLTRLSIGLVLGVLAQVVMGGITVLVDLHPVAVQAHFVLSMVLVATAVVLVRRASLADDAEPVAQPASIRRGLRSVTVATALAILLGTVVTGAGPHAGDESARRFDVSIEWAARVHSLAVWSAIALVALVMFRIRDDAEVRRSLDGAVTLWIAVAIAQAAVGYLQYATDVPPALVAIHVAGATTLWASTIWLVTAPLRTVSGGEAADELGGLVDDRREEPADVAHEVGKRGGTA